MGKKGQMIFGFMVFLIVFVFAIAIGVPVIKEFTSEARDPSNLDCENSTLTIGERSTCIVTDLINPYFLLVIIAAGASFLVLRA